MVFVCSLHLRFGRLWGWWVREQSERIHSNVPAALSPFQGKAPSRIPGSERKHSSEESWLCLSACLPKIPTKVMNW